MCVYSFYEVTKFLIVFWCAYQNFGRIKQSPKDDNVTHMSRWWHVISRVLESIAIAIRAKGCTLFFAKKKKKKEGQKINDKVNRKTCGDKDVSGQEPLQSCHKLKLRKLPSPPFLNFPLENGKK